MPLSHVALNAHNDLPGAMKECSLRAGWRSLLLRRYEEPPAAEEFTTRPTTEHLIVLVVDGACDIEGRYHGRWHETSYRAGSIGMTAPGEEVTLRWRDNGMHTTLQLHLPEAIIRSVHDDLVDRGMRPSPMPHRLSYDDQLIAQSLLSLSAAMSEGAPDLYAETVAHFLASHLFIRHAEASPVATKNIDDPRIRRLDEFMRENLGSAISLEDAATVAGISRFHLVRLFRKIHGETPYRRLTRMRIEEAKRQLAQGRESVTEIAFICGYENPAHFASAFRRWVGASPSEYRGQFYKFCAADSQD
ncbi:AraC family transcriptional regulator [Rhizobium sp. NFR07]|uniref:AraC family transcriptional regulator n=1 Tax=Rhizobium sp. NFR07 TaxID=1566262 RepID=UPI0008E0CDC4|nr:AraC family transcriptional regulator [Rhizobium sp. NFR07]SFB43067.1 AraC family transcriptional regulator [Rhizobium sp. NFR07]